MVALSIAPLTADIGDHILETISKALLLIITKSKTWTF